MKLDLQSLMIGDIVRAKPYSEEEGVKEDWIPMIVQGVVDPELTELFEGNSLMLAPVKKGLIHERYVEIEGEPLTVEWLARFGFGFDPCTKGRHFLHTHVDFEIYMRGKGEPKFWADEERIYSYSANYVHDLQHAYFLATGTKLTLL